MEKLARHICPPHCGSGLLVSGFGEVVGVGREAVADRWLASIGALVGMVAAEARAAATKVKAERRSTRFIFR
jgi:hypothetical protein